jgi:DNA invertase Pin-like site-specific DNA recombinase
MMDLSAAKKNPVGRPRVQVKHEQVMELRSCGTSWCKIAKTLGIGAATAMRLCKSTDGRRPSVEVKNLKRS